MDARENLKKQDISQLTKLIVEDNKVSLTYFLLTCVQCNSLLFRIIITIIAVYHSNTALLMPHLLCNSHTMYVEVVSFS